MVGSKSIGKAAWAVCAGIVATLALGAASPAGARTESFSWTHDNPPAVTGFKLYWDTSSRTSTGGYANSVDVGKPPQDANGVFHGDLVVPDDATIYVAVTAYDANLVESGYSNEKQRAPATTTPPPTTTPTFPPSTFSGTPPYSDDFSNGIVDWGNEVGSWTASNGELQVTTQADSTALITYAGALATDDQCQTMKLVNDVGNAAPGFVFRASSYDLATATRYDVSVDPAGDWTWIPYVNGSWTGQYEGSLPFNTTGQCSSFPCYVSACVSGSGSSRELRVYEHGASQPPADPSQWSGDLAGVIQGASGGLDASGTNIGLRIYSTGSGLLQLIDDWWAGDFTPSGAPPPPPASETLSAPGQPYLVQ